MGQLLISGKGKRNPKGELTLIVIGLVFFVIGIFLIIAYENISSHRSIFSRNSETLEIAVLLFGILCLVSGFFCPFIVHRQKKLNTQVFINVYEDYIQGKGLLQNSFTLQDIKLSYNQITQVDANQHFLIIHTQAQNYNFFVDGHLQIRDIIFDKLSVSKNA